MTMMAATAKVAALMVALMAVVKTVKTVYMISHHTDLNAVIPLGMNMVLTVLT